MALALTGCRGKAKPAPSTKPSAAVSAPRPAPTNGHQPRRDGCWSRGALSPQLTERLKQLVSRCTPKARGYSPLYRAPKALEAASKTFEPLPLPSAGCVRAVAVSEAAWVAVDLSLRPGFWGKPAGDKGRAFAIAPARGPLCFPAGSKLHLRLRQPQSARVRVQVLFEQAPTPPSSASARKKLPLLP